jgi:hypothetical protein
MRLLGELKHGQYENDCKDVHPDILNRYYGFDDEEARMVPDGMGVAEVEWIDSGYGEIEHIPFGRGGRSLEVILPFTIWWPRAVACKSTIWQGGGGFAKGKAGSLFR